MMKSKEKRKGKRGKEGTEEDIRAENNQYQWPRQQVKAGTHLFRGTVIHR
jgi:hypothetical protein